MPFFQAYATQHPLPHNPLRQAPLLGYALMLVAGISVAWSARSVITSSLWMGLASTCAMLALMLTYKNAHLHHRRAATIAGYATLALAGATLCQIAYEKVLVEWPTEPQTWTLRILSIHKMHDNGATIDAEVIGASRDVNGKNVRLSLRGKECKLLAVDDIIAYQGALSEAWQAGNPGEFDYRSYLITHHISGTAFADEKAWIRLRHDAHTWLRTRLLRLRQTLVEKYARHIEGSNLGIVAALTLGDKTVLDADTRALFSDTGTSHILALSGLHLSIIFTLMQWGLLRWVKRRKLFIATHLLAITSLWLFVLMTGSPLSLQRAACMFTLMQLSACLHRSRGTTLNNLSLAAVVMLTLSPLSLFDVGFQMSFAAVLSIVLVDKYLWSRFPLPQLYQPVQFTIPPNKFKNFSVRHIVLTKQQMYRAVKRLVGKMYLFFRSAIYPFITVSLSAQAGTLPFIIYYFHRVPTYGVLANFIVIPAAYCLLAGAFLFFIAPTRLMQDTIAQMLRTVTELMTKGLESINSWPHAVVTMYPTVFTLIVMVVTPCLVYAFLNSQRRRLRLRLIATCTLLVAGSMGAEAYRLRPDRLPQQIIIYNVPHTTIVHFVVSARHSYLYSSVDADSTQLRMKYIEQTFFTPRHISPPTLLTHNTERHPDLLREGEYFNLRQTSLFLLRQNVRGTHTDQPLSIDVLVVCRGCRDSLLTVRKVLHPRQIVLDVTLTPYYRNRWKRECQRANLPCHDMLTEGAFFLPIQSSKP